MNETLFPLTSDVIAVTSDDCYTPRNAAADPYGAVLYGRSA